MTVDLTVSEAMSEFLAALPSDQRPAVARELQRFGRWFGSDRPMSTVKRLDVERYQLQQEQSGAGPDRLEPLRDFFSLARKRGLLTEAVATVIRTRRKSGNGRMGRQSAAETPEIQLTRVGREQLQAQLEQLEQVDRPHGEDELRRAAADKDFRENAPYDAAKQHLAEIHRKINDIKGVLATGTVVEHTASERIGMGSRVCVIDMEDNEQISYTLVGPGEIDSRQGKISIQSPVGRALSDHRVGDVVEVTVPAGVMRYRIERIEKGA